MKIKLLYFSIYIYTVIYTHTFPVFHSTSAGKCQSKDLQGLSNMKLVELMIAKKILAYDPLFLSVSFNDEIPQTKRAMFFFIYNLYIFS